MVHYIVTAFYADDLPQSYDLDSLHKEYVLFGRGPVHGTNEEWKNDLEAPLHADTVSRAHAHFQKIKGNWHIVDDGSTNGLSINGKKFASAQLFDGMRIYIGNSNVPACILSISCVQKEENAVYADVGAKMFSLREKPACTIGRSQNCDIVITHPMASRVHAVIERRGNNYVLNDNHSTNGINLNGIPVREPEVLKNMDRFTIADMTLVFCDGNLYSTVSKGGVSVQTVGLCKTVPVKKGRKLITDHVNLNINPGEFVSIIGGSGAGKTTLLNCLSGMTDFNAGEVLINNDPLSPGNKALKGIIGYVPQQDIVYDDLTLERMLLYSAKLRMPVGTTKQEIREKIDEVLKIVDLTAHRETLIGRLSGGQKKRASMAVELLSDPKLFFLDEPFSGLDPGTEKKLMSTLKQISESGCTVIMVTHSVLSLSMCSRVICMGRGGRLCYSGRPENLCETFGVESVPDVFEQLDNNSEALSERWRQAGGGSNEAGRSISEELRKNRKKKNVLRQFGILTSRYMELSCNRRNRLVLLLLMPVFLTIFVCIAFQMDGGLATTIYNWLKDSSFFSLGASILAKNSHPFLVFGDTQSAMLTFSCAAFWIGMFNSIQEISKERAIYNREAFTGVRPLPYVASKLAVSIMLCLIQSAVMTALLMLLANTSEAKNGDLTGEVVKIFENEETGEMEATGLVLKTILPQGGVVFENALWLEYYITTLLTMMSAMCLGLMISAVFSNDVALVLCPIALLPQILFSDCVSELTGIAQKISNIISCKWSVVAYCTSVDINDMVDFITWGTGKWEVGDTVSNAKFSVTTTPVLSLNPVCSAWLVMGLLCVVFVAVAVIVLHMRSGNGLSLPKLHRKKSQSVK